MLAQRRSADLTLNQPWVGRFPIMLARLTVSVPQ